MASEVDIANRALTKIGAGRITSLTDDLEAARVINHAWEFVRDAELRAHNWNFSIKRDQLAALITTPSWLFTVEYELPSDCLRILQCGESYPGPSLSNYRNSDESAWRIEGRKIVTHYTAPLKVLYVYRVENTGTWDALFAEAFACKLAIEVCDRITGSISRKDVVWREYRRCISEALTCDAIENPPQPLADGAWVMARL